MAINIVPVTSIEACRQIEALHLKIWDSDLIDVVPDHLLITIAKNKGVVLLAYLDNKPIGFSFSFQSETDSGIRKHCSHQTGVLPGKQSSGVGYQLKLAQREAVLAQGIDLITWTFDPLLSRNAYLNIGKLGAISYIYHHNLYGNMRSTINEGLQSDRLEVAWWLKSQHVEVKLANVHLPITVKAELIANPAIVDNRDFLIPSDAPFAFNEATHFIQIPPDIEAIKQADMSLAIAWRTHSRAIFQAIIETDYTITDFIRVTPENKSYYVISKSKPV